MKYVKRYTIITIIPQSGYKSFLSLVTDMSKRLKLVARAQQTNTDSRYSPKCKVDVIVNKSGIEGIPPRQGLKIIKAKCGMKHLRALYFTD